MSSVFRFVSFSIDRFFNFSIHPFYSHPTNSMAAVTDNSIDFDIIPVFITSAKSPSILVCGCMRFFAVLLPDPSLCQMVVPLYFDGTAHVDDLI